MKIIIELHDTKDLELDEVFLKGIFQNLAQIISRHPE